MNKYQEITVARNILELPETVTMSTIKSNYRRLLTEWHPDRHPENQDLCNEKTREIISAYHLIMDYCLHYQYSFTKEAVELYHSPEEWWFERFGSQGY